MIASVVVLYNPDMELTQRAIDLLRQQCDCVVLVDNSSVDRSDVFSYDDNIVYLPLLENKGIATAQNVGIRQAINLGADYLVLCDQDSLLPEGAVSTLLDSLLMLNAEGYRMGVIGSVGRNRQTGNYYMNPINTFGETDVNGHTFVRVGYAMNSISLIPVEVMKEVGLMKDKLFIDDVDCEWCWRANRVYGYDVLLDKSVVIDHMIGEGDRKILGKMCRIASPVRLKYQLRNFIWLSKCEYVPKEWYRFNAKKYFVKCFIYPLMVAPRTKYIKYIWEGIKEGLSNRNALVDQ